MAYRNKEKVLAEQVYTRALIKSMLSNCLTDVDAMPRSDNETVLVSRNTFKVATFFVDSPELAQHMVDLRTPKADDCARITVKLLKEILKDIKDE